VFVRIWRYRLHPGVERQFEDAYGPSGTWVRLFRSGVGYLGTELLRDAVTPGMYLTMDRWESVDAWTAFLATHRAEYDALDRACESLTAGEESLGDYVDRRGRA
jgi:heme-degrading monooxygenase HmoA